MKISANFQVYDLSQNLKMTKISQFCSIHQENTCKSSLQLNLIILTDFHNFTVNEGKLQKTVNLKISANLRVCDFSQNLKFTKTSQFCSIHQENTCKSSLHSNLIILTDFHSFTVNEEKPQN